MKIRYCTYILHFLYNIAQIKTPLCKNKISEIKWIKLKTRIIKKNITIMYNISTSKCFKMAELSRNSYTCK